LLDIGTEGVVWIYKFFFIEFGYTC
jgi:hypothetical protein